MDKKSQPKPKSESNSPSIEIETAEQIKQLQEQVDFWSQTAQNHLTNLQRTTAQLDQAGEQIKALQSQPNQLSQEIATALKEANQKIRELEGENKQLAEKYSQLEKQSKITEETKPKETKTQATQTPQPSEPKLYLFTCDICQQNKKSQLHLARVNGLGIDPHKQNKICSTCLRKVDIIQAQKEDFF